LQAELKDKISALEAELSLAEARTAGEAANATQKHLDDLQKFREENRQLALTICELEESLDKATTMVKEYKLEIASLERTLAGHLMEFTALGLMCDEHY